MSIYKPCYEHLQTAINLRAFSPLRNFIYNYMRICFALDLKKASKLGANLISNGKAFKI